MRIEIDVDWMVPSNPCRDIQMGEQDVAASLLFPTARVDVQVSSIPQQVQNAAHINLLKAKLRNTIVEHFAEIEKERMEAVIRDAVIPKAISEDEVKTLLKATTIDDMTKGNK